VRIGKALIVVGLALIIVSFTGWTNQGFGTNMDYGEYEGVMIRTASDFNLTVTSDTTSFFSLYIYEFEEGMEVIRTGFFENRTPIAEKVNISIFNEIIIIPKPSWYVVLVTATENVSIYIDFTINRILPQRLTIISGSVGMCMGMLILVIRRIMKKAELG